MWCQHDCRKKLRLWIVCIYSLTRALCLFVCFVKIACYIVPGANQRAEIFSWHLSLKTVHVAELFMSNEISQKRKWQNRYQKWAHFSLSHFASMVVSEFFFSTFPLVAVRALIRIVQRERRMKPSVLFPSWSPAWSTAKLKSWRWPTTETIILHTLFLSQSRWHICRHIHEHTLSVAPRW